MPRSFIMALCMGIMVVLSGFMPVYAQSITTDSATVTILTPTDTVSDNQDTITLGLAFDLKPDWKIYWKNPGIAGYPPSVTLTHNDKSIEGMVMDFPPPVAKTVLDAYSYVYENRVVFPLTVPLKNIKNVPLSMAINWVACNTICLPQNTVFKTQFTTPTSGEKIPFKIDAQTIQKWQAKIPVKLANADPKITAQITLQDPNHNKRILTITTPPTPRVFLYHNDYPIFTPQWQKHDLEKSTFAYSVKGEISAEKPLNITLTQQINNQSQHIEVNRYITISQYEKNLFFIMAVMAFFGGLILNIMPCVLPVIGIKALSLTNAIEQGHSKTKIRLSFVFTSVGIVLSFLVLGMVLYTLKSTSQVVGWGMQFQNPIFLWVLFITITAFALILILDYSIPLPAFIRTMDTDKNGYMGDVFRGVLAMILSTPCSAPILGTAIGLILTLDTVAIPALFTVMGLGMAFPYLLFATMPKTLSLLPKPGAWMNTFKRSMGILLAITAIWLGWLAVGSVMPSKSPQSTEISSTSSIWQPWDVTEQSVIKKAVAGGQTVLIDITADWCLTCQFNKISTLNTAKTIQFLKQNNVLLLQEDWTQTDDNVPAYLSTFDRYGIPFNVVYGPSAPNGIVLPEIVSYDDIVTAIKQAK